MEQEIASIIKAVLDSAGNPMPYYHEIPQDFFSPCIFFPEPDVRTAGDTLCSYRLDFSLDIMFRAEQNNEAHRMAMNTVAVLKGAGNLVALLDESGQETGDYIRTGEMSVKVLDSCSAELSLQWVSRRPYAKAVQWASMTKVQKFIAENWPEKYISKQAPESFDS